DHAIRELQEGLIEHGLTVVPADDGRVESHAWRRGGNHAWRNALRDRLFLEVLQPALIAAGIAAGGAKGFAGQGEHESKQCQALFRHRSYPLVIREVKFARYPVGVKRDCTANYFSSCALRPSVS